MFPKLVGSQDSILIGTRLINISFAKFTYCEFIYFSPRTWVPFLSKMEAPIVKDGGSNYQRLRLQIWRLQIVNNLATNPPFFLLC